MPTPKDVIFFATPAELRSWFEANHESAAELWVGSHRKSTGRPSIAWQDLVDQALCFGWIDSVRYSLGNGSAAQRVTPRRKRSVWSAVNIRRFQELEAMGFVHPRGRAAFAARDEARSGVYSYESPAQLDPAMEAEFRKNAAAWRFFEGQPPGYRRLAIHWVGGAKREETRRRRLNSLIDSSAQGRRLPPWGRA